MSFFNGQCLYPHTTAASLGKEEDQVWGRHPAHRTRFYGAHSRVDPKEAMNSCNPGLEEECLCTQLEDTDVYL